MSIKKDKIDTVAIGRFDGIHRGHMKLISKLGTNGALVVIDKDDANLTPFSKRSEYSKYPCMYYHFEKIRNLNGYEFIDLLCRDFPNLKKIIVGYDFAYGKGRAYEAKDLKKMFTGEVEIIEEFLYDGISVHSSTIRDMIIKGDIHEANRLLGREYAISGDIIKGQGVGKKEVYPTMNLSVSHFLLPQNGVYATRTFIEDEVYESVSFVGIRYSVDRKFAVETHIIDKNFIDKGNTRFVSLTFVEFLRENKEFKSLKELKKQIGLDIEQARKILPVCRVYFEDKSR